MRKTINNSVKRLSEIWAQTHFWGVHQAILLREVSLNNWGSDELFIYDINNDGIPEFLWLQNQGIYKSNIYFKKNENYRFLENSRGLDCLTATNIQGEVLWQNGKPYCGDKPYCSHAAEKMLEVYTLDKEVPRVVMLAAPNILRVLDGRSGKIERELLLPQDNFSWVEPIHLSSDIYFLVGVMDQAIGPYEYGNPTLILNSRFEIQQKFDKIGSGHQIWVHDFNHDGEDEFMLGYQVLNVNGDTVWTLDSWIDCSAEYKPVDQHVDSISPIKIGDKWFAAIAGSDLLYWITEQGHVLWHHTPRHAQYVLVGKFKGPDAEAVIILVESKHGTNLSGFSLEGRKMWEKDDLMNWPMGKPKCIGNNPPHMDIPAVLWKSPDKRPDLVIYFEGGWPYGMNGSGKVVVTFPCMPSAKKPEASLPKRRPNDLGYGYQTRCADVDGDGEQEVIIYDRRYMWVYKIPKFI